MTVTNCNRRHITYSAGVCETEIDFVLVKEKFREYVRNVKVISWELRHRLVVVDLDKKVVRKQRIYRRDGVVVEASALQSVDLGFNLLVESHQNTLKYNVDSFPCWRSAFRGSYEERAGKFACCVVGEGT